MPSIIWDNTPKYKVQHLDGTHCTCWYDVEDTRSFLHAQFIATPAEQSAVVKFRHGSVGGRATGPVRSEVRSGNIDDLGCVVELPGEVDSVLRIRLKFTRDPYCFLAGDPMNFLLTWLTDRCDWQHQQNILTMETYCAEKYRTISYDLLKVWTQIALKISRMMYVRTCTWRRGCVCVCVRKHACMQVRMYVAYVPTDFDYYIICIIFII
jgi:hypothetical protein